MEQDLAGVIERVTLGEVYRLVVKLDSKIDGLSVVHADVYAAEKAEVVRRLAELEDGRKWLVRMVGGAMGTAVLSLVVSQAK